MHALEMHLNELPHFIRMDDESNTTKKLPFSLCSWHPSWTAESTFHSIYIYIHVTEVSTILHKTTADSSLLPAAHPGKPSRLRSLLSAVGRHWAVVHHQTLHFNTPLIGRTSISPTPVNYAFLLHVNTAARNSRLTVYGLSHRTATRKSENKNGIILKCFQIKIGTFRAL